MGEENAPPYTLEFVANEQSGSSYGIQYTISGCLLHLIFVN